MRPELVDVAEEVEARLSQLNQEEASIQARLSEVQSEKVTLNAASERINSLRSSKGKLIEYGCPNCYVFHGIDFEMTPIPSEQEHVDSFRCHKCDYELEIEY